MRKPKIVSRMAIPFGDFVFYMEVDENGETHCFEYEVGYYMNHKEISEQVGFSETMVSKVLRESIKKILNYIKTKEGKNLNTLEIVNMVSGMLGIESKKEYSRFFRLLPENIKNEVIDYANRQYT